jgi:hypothetical protein
MQAVEQLSTRTGRESVSNQFCGTFFISEAKTAEFHVAAVQAPHESKDDAIAAHTFVRSVTDDLGPDFPLDHQSDGSAPVWVVLVVVEAFREFADIVHRLE